MKHLFDRTYEGKKILVTGHTGFKGSWLCLWLHALGAKVIGYSLAPATQPNNFTLTHLADLLEENIIGDIRNANLLEETIQRHEPEIIFHLAAQSIVIHGYDHPKETFETNVMGTINLLEAARKSTKAKALVVVTTDKCYENKEWIWGYRENDRLGGKDPYSASKSMAEIATESYRTSYFSSTADNQPLQVATARAGNVIGGGDFSEHRIVPDCMRGLLYGETIQVRNPNSVRPWLHVLDPLSGYLWLGAHLFNKGSEYAEAWNFGPIENEPVTVQSLVEKAIELWRKGNWENMGTPNTKKETGMLRLNWDKAANKLGWLPVYSWDEAIEETVLWFSALEKHRADSNSIDLKEICLKHIEQYTEKANLIGLPWTHKKENKESEPCALNAPR